MADVFILEASFALVRQELAREEELEEARGSLALHKMSASGMILWGMRIEEQQCVTVLFQICAVELKG